MGADSRNWKKGAALILELLLSRILTAPTAPLALIMVYILLMFACYLCFGRLDGYQSVYQFIRRGIQFQREQQKFYYKRRKEALSLEEAESAGPGVPQH